MNCVEWYAYSVTKVIVDAIKKDELHPLTWASKVAKSNSCLSISANRFVGWIIPLLCFLNLLLGLVLVYLGVWRTS